MKRIKTFFKTEWAKFRKMSFAEKRWYIWEYYKLHIVAFIGVAILLGSLINSWVNPQPQTYLYIVWHGIPAHFFQLDDLAEGLGVIVEDGERQRVEVTDYTPSGNIPLTNALMARYTTLLQMGELDVIIMPRGDIYSFATRGHIRTADELMEYLEGLNPQMHAGLGDRLLPMSYLMDEDERVYLESDYIVAISLRGSPILARFEIDCGDAYLSVIVNTQRLHAVAKVLEVLLDGA